MAIPQPSNVIEFKLPKRRPKVVEKAMPPDQRKIVVVPLKAARDRRVTDSQLRTLTVLCSYTNRAGITWVRQERIGQDLGVSKQSISKQMKRLVELGYVEIVSKGFKGEKANTLRVIFDESISADDAISIASNVEDCRPPERIRKDHKAMEDSDLPDLSPEQIEANKKRLAALLGNMATKQTGTQQGGYQMTGTETKTVREIKERIAKKKPGRAPKAQPKAPHSQLNTVDHVTQSHSQPKPVDNSLHSQLHSQPNRVDQNIETIGIDRLYKVIDIVNNKVNLSVLVNLNETDVRWLEHLANVGVTEAEMTQALLDLPAGERVAHAARNLLAAKGLA